MGYMASLVRSGALLVAIYLATASVSDAKAQGNSENHRNDPGNNGQGNGGGGNGNNGGGGGGNDGNGGGGGNGTGNGGNAGGGDHGGGGETQGAVNPSSGPPLSDSERALEAVRSGQAMPLERVAATAAEDHPGRMIDAQLITVGNFLLYELKVLEPDGDVVTVYYYARSGIEVRSD
jgi:hypothetical protein